MMNHAAYLETLFRNDTTPGGARCQQPTRVTSRPTSLPVAATSPKTSHRWAERVSNVVFLVLFATVSLGGLIWFKTSILDELMRVSSLDLVRLFYIAI